MADYGVGMFCVKLVSVVESEGSNNDPKTLTGNFRINFPLFLNLKLVEEIHSSEEVFTP